MRLYPIDYRYRPTQQQFHKYQWISVELESSGAGNDNRKESRRPKLESIEILGKPLSTKNSWQDRRNVIDGLPHHTVHELKQQHEHDKTSLGVVRPTRVLDMTIEETDRQWKPEWDALFRQYSLFGDIQKPLAKIPYKFRYVFECEDSKKPHRIMCEDWELGVLFLKEAERLGSEEKAIQSVKEKFLNDLCSPRNDTRFFMGTIFPYNTWVVLGVFYPPKIDTAQQLTLF